jgi:hypothetical protein
MHIHQQRRVMHQIFGDHQEHRPLLPRLVSIFLLLSRLSLFPERSLAAPAHRYLGCLLSIHEFLLSSTFLSAHI